MDQLGSESCVYSPMSSIGSRWDHDAEKIRIIAEQICDF